MFEPKGEEIKRLLSSPYRDILGREKENITLRRRLELVLRKERKRRREASKVNELPGEWVSTPYGEVLVRERVYPWDYRHGDFPIGRALELPRQAISFLLPDLSADVDLSQFLFIDTETSGLAMGTGTYIFLFGAGFLVEEGFKVVQYFIKDYSQEQAMLHLIEELLSKFSLLVSFNGRRFDISLLETRFIINRMGMELDQFPHIDLLYPSRLLWRRVFPDCRLITLEREVLSFLRFDDIPGEEIPWRYFHYLRTGDLGLVLPIFEHNLLDILSLLALFFFIASLLSSPAELAPLLSADFSALGRFFEEREKLETSVACYQEELKGGGKRAYQAAKRLSLIYKRTGDYPSALPLWRLMRERMEGFDPFPYEEEAKYYEHKAKDYQRAKRLVEEAITRFKETEWILPPSKREEIYSLLHHRLKRLVRKLTTRNQEEGL
ncbi:MAG: ribonuclease H-like domain-containing protein [Acidobacteria bacterium]|nr:ribonuclease H-like domain-containing protein [Acidobacteriota bacterium]